MGLLDGIGSLFETSSVAQTDAPPTTQSTLTAPQSTQEDGQQTAINRVTDTVAANQPTQFEIDLRAAAEGASTENTLAVRVTFPKLPAEMDYTDYVNSYLRALFKSQGLSDVTDAELARFQHDLTAVLNRGFGVQGEANQQATLTAYRAQHEQHGGEVKWGVSEWGLAQVQAGRDEIFRRRQTTAEQIEQLRVESHGYGTDALKGWASLHVDSAVNVANAVTEPLRGVGNLAFGVEIPEAPRLGWHRQSEYWQRDGRGQVAEIAGTLYLGGRAGGAALATTTGKAVVTGEAIYNIGAGAAGVDPTQNDATTESGLREMGAGERTLRVAGGVVGAAGVAQGLGGASRTTSGASSTIAEAVTPDGQTLRVPVTDDALTATQMEARAAREIGGRRNVESHEAKPSAPELKGHTIEMHVGKSENWLRKRLETDPTLRDQPFASSFRNEQVANRVQGRFYKQYREQIDEWLRSGSDKPFKAIIDMGEPVGIVAERGKGGAVETNKAFVMLIRDDSPQGWHFLTSYPVTKNKGGVK